MSEPTYREILIDQRTKLQNQINKINKIIDILSANPEFEELIKLVREMK